MGILGGGLSTLHCQVVYRFFLVLILNPFFNRFFYYLEMQQLTAVTVYIATLSLFKTFWDVSRLDTIHVTIHTTHTFFSLSLLSYVIVRYLQLCNSYRQSITSGTLKIAFRWSLFNTGNMLISEIIKNRFYGLTGIEWRFTGFYFSQECPSLGKRTPNDLLGQKTYIK
jgi:hypothetical protein